MMLELPDELAVQLHTIQQQTGFTEAQIIAMALSTLAIPNKETQNAMDELAQNHGIAFDSVESLMTDLLSDA